jgi:hypothetical protein
VTLTKGRVEHRSLDLQERKDPEYARGSDNVAMQFVNKNHNLALFLFPFFIVFIKAHLKVADLLRKTLL